MAASTMQIDRQKIRCRYRVFLFVRGDNDFDWDWRFLGEHMTHTRASVALTEWLHEHDCLPGLYRIEGPDGYAETRTYEGEESL